MSENQSINREITCKEYCRLNCLNWKKNVYSKLQIIMNILKIICLIPILILSKTISFDSEITNPISNEFLDNFQTGYILDFYKCNSNENRIKLGTWQGTVKGCGSEKNGIKKARIPKENKDCKKDEITIEKIPPQNIFVFKGLTICGKTKEKYYDLLFSDSVIEKNQDCPEGFKNCGYIDTMKNKLCLKKDSQCPISYIKIKDVNSPPPDNITNLKVIENENIKFYYSNDPYEDTPEVPYIQNSFKIADSIICSLPNLYYSNLDLFILDAFKKGLSPDCMLKDYSQNITIDNLRYHKLNTINQYELYKENGIIDIITNNNLNDFGFNVEKYKENNLNIYINSHFGFNKTCLKHRKYQFNINELSEILSTSDKMFFWGNFIFWVYIASFGLILSESFNIFMFIGCNLNIENIIKIFINNLCSLITFFYSLIWGLSYDNPYEKIMECSDIVSNSNYNIMIEKIYKNGQTIKFCCYILLIFLFLNLFSFIIFIVECSCGQYCNERCRSCCCDCCINCWNGNKKKKEKKEKKSEVLPIEKTGESKKENGNNSLDQNKNSINNEGSKSQVQEESSKDQIITNNQKLFKNQA